MDMKVDEHSTQIFLRSLFALIKILIVSTLVVICNGQLNYLFFMMHKTMSFFNFQLKF
jgi:hypothetical protein